ncbi:MAG: phosphatase PAP2 family protein [Patescibacteria group bacterium]
MDVYIYQAINEFSRRYWLVDYIAIFTAEYLGYFLVLTALFFIFKEKKWSDKIYFFSLISLSLILSRGIIAEVIKFFSHRQRPFVSLNIQPLIEKNDIYMSFPSGHAAFYFTLAFSILLFYFAKEKKFKNKIGLWFFGFAVLMGISRIFTGIHWPSDVLVGAIIGVVSSFLVKKILDIEFKSKIENKIGEEKINI